jgi:hypothetical protein
MKNTVAKVLSASLVLLFLVSACNTTTPTPLSPTVDVGALKTQAARDVLASLTANAPTKTPRPTATPQPTKNPVPCPQEDFTGSDWNIVNNTGTAEFLPDLGKIEITANGGSQDLYAGVSMDAPRVIKKISSEAFVMDTRVTLPKDANVGGFQGSGLVLYFNTLNYAWVVESAAGNVEAVYTLKGERKNFFPNAISVGTDVIYVAFKVSKMQIIAGYSVDGLNYTWSNPVVFDTSSLRGGVTVLSAWDTPGYSGVFECFEIKPTN